MSGGRDRIMLLGTSESGKTTEAHRLMRATGRTINVLNDDEKNTPDDFVRCSWAQLPKLHDEAILVEDCISLTDEQVAALRLLLLKDSHHRSVACCCCC